MTFRSSDCGGVCFMDVIQCHCLDLSPQSNHHESLSLSSRSVGPPTEIPMARLARFSAPDQSKLAVFKKNKLSSFLTYSETIWNCDEQVRNKSINSSGSSPWLLPRDGLSILEHLTIWTGAPQLRVNHMTFHDIP